MFSKFLEAPIKEIMIFKDDDGFWRILSETGLGINKYKSYESAVYSLPNHLQEGLI
jgi:hypothetical protein